MSCAIIVVALVSLFTLDSARSFPAVHGVSSKELSSVVVGLNLFSLKHRMIRWYIKIYLKIYSDIVTLLSNSEHCLGYLKCLALELKKFCALCRYISWSSVFEITFLLNTNELGRYHNLDKRDLIFPKPSLRMLLWSDT